MHYQLQYPLVYIQQYLRFPHFSSWILNEPFQQPQLFYQHWHFLQRTRYIFQTIRIDRAVPWTVYKCSLIVILSNFLLQKHCLMSCMQINDDMPAHMINQGKRFSKLDQTILSLNQIHFLDWHFSYRRFYQVFLWCNLA